MLFLFQFPKPVSALGELFAVQDRISKRLQDEPPVQERVHKEIELYKELSPILTSHDPVHWWFAVTDRLPLLSQPSSSYLCVQAVFSTDTLCPERSRLHADKVDILIFLQKKCLVCQQKQSSSTSFECSSVL